MAERPGPDQRDSPAGSTLTETDRLAILKKRERARLFFSVALIALGVLLFLGNLGILPIHEVWIFWPLLPILGGIGRLVSRGSPSARLWGVLMILFGALFLLLNLGVIHIHTRDGSWPFSLILIAVGFAALFSVLEARNPSRAGYSCKMFRPRRSLESLENAVNDFAVLGAIKRKLETQDFQGGELTAVLGNIEIDLRPSHILGTSGSVVLHVTAIFGAVKIRIPQGWRIYVRGASVLGNFEDKTVPPNTGPGGPSLVIAGWSVFGSVEIED